VHTYLPEKTNISNKLQESIDISQRFTDIPILKLSGYGEFTLFPNFLSFFQENSHYYQKMQLITNGSLLTNKTIKKSTDIENMVVLLSLDGHTCDLNQLRTSKKKLARVLTNLHLLYDYGVKVEINSVLTKYNTTKFDSFLNYLSTKLDGVICFPFPVRDFLPLQNKLFFPSKDDGIIFRQKVLKKYDDYSHVLPPKEYMERLCNFFDVKTRSWPCYVGFFSLAVNPRGEILTCPCGPKDTVGNIFKDSKKAFTQRAQNEIFNRIRMSRQVYSGCINCFTHYDLINLFFDGVISLRKFNRFALFSDKKTQRRLQELKKMCEKL
jgi:radical SAM protein with 4Fe4S-binding SPASM domain